MTAPGSPTPAPAGAQAGDGPHLLGDVRFPLSDEELDGGTPLLPPTTVPARRAVGDLWERIEPYLAGNGRRLALFTVTSTVSGFGEAAVLYVVVRVATALARRRTRSPSTSDRWPSAAWRSPT